MAQENFHIKLKKVFHAIEHDITQLDKVVAKIAVAAVKVLKNIGEDVAFAPLLIFKSSMKNEIIRREGSYNGDNTLLDVTGKFAQSIFQDYRKPVVHFDYIRHHADSGFDNYGLPVAPAYIKMPLHMALTAVGVPDLPTGAPPPEDIVWGFFHKHCQEKGHDCNNAINKALKTGIGEDTTIDFFGHKIKIAAFFTGNKTFWIIASAIITLFIVRTIYKHFKK